MKKMRRKVADLAVEFILKQSIENLRELTVQKIAEALAISSDYLSQQFKEDQNISCPEFILREKLHRAFFILTKERDISIAQLAKELGFSNAEYFSSEFETYHAVTPERFIEINSSRAD
jgi:two-component system response regulator YesN